MGTFSADDQDEEEVSFLLTEGDGDDDNAHFTISGISLRTNGLITDDGAEDFHILVEAEDASGGFTVQPFVLTVEEVLGLISLAKSGISVFPNPVSDELHIKMINQKAGPVSLTINTIDGKVVYRHSWDKEGELLKDELSVGHLPVGVYVLHFEVQGKRIVGRLIRR